MPNPNLSGLFRGLFQGFVLKWGGEGKTTSCLKFVRTLLEFCNLVRKGRYIYAVSENTSLNKIQFKAS